MNGLFGGDDRQKESNVDWQEQKEIEMRIADRSFLKRLIGGGSAGTVIFVSAVCALLYGCPNYGVYEQRLAGEAELAKAEFSKRVQVTDAEGRLAAAVKLADVEIARARGVAEANRIIGDSLKGNDAYLRYLWIDKLDQKGQVIYVPTEAGLPILEAGKRQ